ncbi:hypothetical protein E2C01_070419 [Portunus trituberculatus]|uniref:Uncharacterized protein n=1 Tax=Portunus trituberculatus TaxID=210409 RepID=A0A5B7I572_PORTR|nr:hypothetical protein [Portunus trituberculatus]
MNDSTDLPSVPATANTACLGAGKPIVIRWPWRAGLKGGRYGVGGGGHRSGTYQDEDVTSPRFSDRFTGLTIHQAEADPRKLTAAHQDVNERLPTSFPRVSTTYNSYPLTFPMRTHSLLPPPHTI